MKKLKEILNKKNIILFILILLSLTAGFINLHNKDLDFDETITVVISQQPLNQIYASVNNIENNPPLYYYISHFLISLTKDVYILRLFSVLCFGLAVFFTFKLTDKMFDENTAIIASVLLITSTFAIKYAQFARNYMLTVALAMGSLYFYYLLSKKPKNNKYKTAHYIITALGFYTTYFFVFILISQIINYYFRKKSFKETFTFFWKPVALCSLIIISLIPLLINQVQRVQTGFWIPVPTLHSLVDLFAEFSSGYIIMYVLIPIFIFIIITLFQNHKKREEKYLLLGTFLIPIIVIFVFSLFNTPLFLSRYFVMFVPAFYIIIAKGIKDIAGKYAIFIILLLILITPFTVGYYYTHSDTGMKDGSTYLKDSFKPGEVVLHVSQYTYFPEKMHNNNSLERKLIVAKTNSIGYQFIPSNEIIKDLKSLENYTRIWIFSQDKYLEINFSTEEHSQLKLQKEIIFKEIKIKLYEKK